MKKDERKIHEWGEKADVKAIEMEKENKYKKLLKIEMMIMTEMYKGS